MRTEDLQFISVLGQALYANPSQAKARSLETAAAVSTLSLSDQEGVERALALMLHQAERDGLKASAAQIHSPFFRLTPKERFLLFLLHSGRASYKKLSHLLSTSIEEVQEMAWLARTKIASSPEVRLQAPHPPGSSRLKVACPEYLPSRPWTQKFLDDEMAHAELTFLQNHTAVCRECQRALNLAREFYYAVEKWVPLEQSPDPAFTAPRIQKQFREAQIRSGKLPPDLTIMEAARLFFSRKETLLGTLLFALIFGLMFYVKTN